jgi:hypothetical protein
MSVGRSTATANAPICAQACAAHITTTPRFTLIGSIIAGFRQESGADRARAWADLVGALYTLRVSGPIQRRVFTSPV